MSPNSDYWIQKADFTKLRHVSLTYQVPPGLLKFASNASVTLSGENLYTWSPYRGADPEVMDFSDQNGTECHAGGQLRPPRLLPDPERTPVHALLPRQLVRGPEMRKAMSNHSKPLSVLILAVVLPLGACHGLFDVVSPGRIADTDLNTKDALSGLVAGMSWAVAEGENQSLERLSLFSGDLWHAGSYDFGDNARGKILPEEVNGEWGEMERARWVAEDGVRRMKEEILSGSADAFAKSAYAAQAYMWEGFGDRLLGENVCAAVIDGGAEQPDTVYFQRAQDEFTQAIQIGQAAGDDETVTAAYGGRATVRAWQGDWDGAVQDAMQVPDDFMFDAPISTEMQNRLAYETHTRYEYSVYSTVFEDHPDDPRVPWTILYNADGSVARGANGSTPMYQQNKYDSYDSGVPLTKGTEMLVLRAEAALRGNDIAGAYALMNQARAVYGMDPLPVAADMTAAWNDLHYERMATVWLENRKLWDMRRWFAASGPEHYDYLSGRDRCVPVSQEEVNANPNIP